MPSATPQAKNIAFVHKGRFRMSFFIESLVRRSSPQSSR